MHDAVCHAILELILIV